MHLESRITWEKLSIELELLSSEDSTSMVQLLLGLNGLLNPAEPLEGSSRTLNFMTYELMAQAESLPEPERLDHLNQYFFQTKGFQILELSPADVQERHLLLKPVLEHRAGSPITVAILYLHLAAHLDLPAYLIQMRNHFLLKWVRSGRSCYVDLCAAGQVLKEEELVEIMSRTGDGAPTDRDALSLLPNRKLLLRYVESLMRVYERSRILDRLRTIYNVILKIEPQNSRVLGRRALLHKDLGLQKESLQDLKRYFSFVDPTQAPADLVQALEDLSKPLQPSAQGPSDLLH